ncbi:MAG: amino acid permease [Pseudomonadota bacterium]
MTRSFGLAGATGIGVGAIVGGGILALAGVAFSITGPGAIVAFALNGVIAVITALSFAEMSTAFPESGGTYTFAKKVLSVEAAFVVGWIVWFASVVAAVLYALGFAAYGVVVLEHVWRAAWGDPPPWLSGHWAKVALAAGATAFYSFGLIRKSSGGGQWATIGKVVVFAVLIAGGLWALGGASPAAIGAKLTPFFPGGTFGLLQAMGFTFITLQGFDIIATVAGEVRDPGRTLPRAMLISLGTALIIYLPLLFIVATVGMKAGQTIAGESAANPETIIATAAGNYLGPFGFWLVIVAAVLAMLSALQANLLAASRVARAMAADRTLPGFLDRLSSRQTPTAAILASSGLVMLFILAVRRVETAGAAASLIFLVSFAAAHWTNILMHRRGGAGAAPFRVPWFPLFPVTGAAACMALAAFQGICVPSAGLVVVAWLGLGVVLYMVRFAPRARAVDAASQAYDPALVRLRGKSPLVLVPIANPASAEPLVGVADALAPPDVGRVVLLSVVSAPGELKNGECSSRMLEIQSVLQEALSASLRKGMAPDYLITVASEPWKEIARVAGTHNCESLLLGMSDLSGEHNGSGLEDLLGSVDANIVVLRAPAGWTLSGVRRVLVPLGGRGRHSELRARLLGSLCRTGEREVTFLSILPRQASEDRCMKARRELARAAHEEVPFHSQVEVIREDDAVGVLVDKASESDLVILGLQRRGRRRKMFGDTALKIARDTACGIIMISQRG